MEFDKLRETLELSSAGRLNAARSVWLALPEDFRNRVVRFTIFALRNQRVLDFVARMTSSYGDFELSNEFLDQLRQHIPRINHE